MHNLNGARVAKQLFATEDAIDLTIVETAKLVASMGEARIANRLPAVAGQRAIAAAIEALAALERARHNVLETHEELTSLRDEYGFVVEAAGALHKPEPTVPTGSLAAA